jgi:hypothetical protein
MTWRVISARPYLEVPDSDDESDLSDDDFGRD